MITVSELTKTYGGRTLFENVNVKFTPGVNYGLTGPNGAGKSTFMKLLMKHDEPDHGHVSIPERTAYLRQDHYAFDDQRVIDTVIMGNRRLWDAMVQKELLYAKSELTNEDGALLGELECIVAEEDGYSAEAEAATLLSGLGIEESLHDMQMKNIQGGLKLRVLLAQALFGKPDALLLDEPTNHLDLDSIRWLEGFLIDYRGVLVVISHDRRFLNAICDQIADIDFESIILYPGAYDDMVRQKAEVRGRVEKENTERQQKISQLQDFISRFGAGTRASQTRSRARQIEKLKPDEIKRSNIARPFIQFPSGERSGKHVLNVRDLAGGYDGDAIFSGFSSIVARGEKVAIIGKSGVGKTTLVRTLLGQLAPLRGTIEWGHATRVGYMSQNHHDDVPNGVKMYEWLHSQRPTADEQHVRSILGRMLFSKEDGFKATDLLSGGERSRLLMSKIALMEYNVLFLDEPTNHLDLESISSLGEAIERYDGTIFYVTHDRDLASRANRLFAYDGQGKLHDFEGSIDAWLEKMEAERAGGGRRR